MSLCKLCQKEEANQTGSHIISAFYLKPVIGKRGEEKGYTITADPFQNFRENTGASPVVEDYILCSGCEKRLSYVEGYIAEELTNKFGQDKFSANFKKTDLRRRLELVECTRMNSLAYKIFVYSLIWRASISSSGIFRNFSLTDEEAESIRYVLNSAIPLSDGYKGVTTPRKEWLKMLNEEYQFSFKFPFIVVSPRESTEETSGFVLFYPEDREPYGLLIGDSLIYFNVSSKNFRDGFGILSKVNSQKLYNKEPSDTKIVLLPKDKWDPIKKKLIKNMTDRRRALFYNVFEQYLISREGSLPPNWKMLARAAFAQQYQALREQSENIEE